MPRGAPFAGSEISPVAEKADGFAQSSIFLDFRLDVRDTVDIEYRFGSVALHACSSDRAPESASTLPTI
jgi:hypothetical protein